jgi:ParB-like chromosome segregation protein Spo0J
MKNPELKVELARTVDLVPYAGNAKIHSAEQVEQIAASIEEFGFDDPVGVWTNADGEPEIVEGHGRVMAANLLGMEHVPVIYLDHLTDEQRRAYVHVHNQTTLSSGFDLDALAADMADLPTFDWAEFGFDEVAGAGGEEGETEYAPFDEELVIVVEVDELEIEEVFGRLTEEGYKCRILTL